MAKKKSFEFFPPDAKRAPTSPYLTEYFNQVPFGHLIGIRHALLFSPCCARRLRVHIFENCRGWKHEPYVRCPNCRRFWKVELTLTESGFARRAKLKL